MFHCVKKQNSNNDRRGTSMIEVLVALLVLSVGLLGFAKLQLQTMKQSNDAFKETLSTLLAEDMIERVRANSAESSKGSAGNYHNPTIPASVTSCMGKDDEGQFDLAAVCSSSEMALFDVDEWQSSVENNLPSASAIICLDSTPEDPATHGRTKLGEAGCDGLLKNGRLLYTVRILWDAGTTNPVNNKLGNFRAYIGAFEP